MEDGHLVAPRQAYDAGAQQWSKVNPDGYVDLLPQPYRRINSILEEIIEEVNDEIDIREARKKSEEYESGLQTFAATTSLPVPGRVTCACSEGKLGSHYIALGTSNGEVMLIDAHRTPKIVAQKGAFVGAEVVHCIALSSEGSLQAPVLPKLPGVDRDEMLANAPTLPKKGSKLIVAGVSTPRILVYDIAKETFGFVLHPSCAVHVPPQPEPTDDAEDRQRPVVDQLRVQGSTDAIWVLALLPDRSVCAYLAPVGLVSSDTEDRRGSVTDQVIHEHDEDEEEDAGSPRHGDEFKEAVQIQTPTYRIPLPELAPFAGLPEPSLSEVFLSFITARPEGVSKSATKVPSCCFLTSSTTNVVLAYSLWGPPTRAAGVPDTGARTLEALLQDVAPLPGKVQEPGEPITLRPERRWTLPSCTSCVATSVGGGIFAVGGAHGALALISVGFGPGLSAMLPGHYGAIAAMSFHRDTVLVSLGEDSWVHHYCMKTNSLLFRHLCTPPPAPPPGKAIAAATLFPIALTLDGGARPLKVSTQSKRNEDITKILIGDYAEMGQHHGRQYYKKMQKTDLDNIVFLYYWDERDGADNVGWRFADEVGGTQVWARAAMDTPTPPRDGWLIPWDAKKVENGALVIEPATGGNLRLLDLRSGKKLAQATYRKSDPSVDKAFERVEGAPPFGPDEELRLISLGSIFCVLREATTARRSSSEGDASHEVEEFSDIFFFDVAKVPGAPKREDLNSTLKTQEPQAAALDSTMKSVTSVKSNASSQARKQSTKARESSQIVELTTENLKMLGKSSLARTGSITARSEFGPGPVGQQPAIATAAMAPAGALRAHLVPDGWQAAVRRNFKAGHVEKTLRQARVNRRTDQLRKGLAEASAGA